MLDDSTFQIYSDRTTLMVGAIMKPVPGTCEEKERTKGRCLGHDGTVVHGVQSVEGDAAFTFDARFVAVGDGVYAASLRRPVGAPEFEADARRVIDSAELGAR